MIAGTRIVLRPVLPTDYPVLHAMELDPTTESTWRYHGPVPALAEYERALWQQTQQILVVESRRTGDVIGYTQLHDLDLRAGHAYFSTYASPEHRGSGLVMEGTAALCSWAFENWPLRWLYAHCLPQNLRQFESTVRRGSMMHLGVLRERMVIDGELTDIHVLGMEREQWFAGSLHRGFARQRRADHPA